MLMLIDTSLPLMHFFFDAQRALDMKLAERVSLFLRATYAVSRARRYATRDFLLR